MKNDYFDIADRDRKWIDFTMIRSKEVNDFNLVVYLCQQVVEKYLKGAISSTLNTGGKYDKELRSHNLRLLAKIINTNLNTHISMRDMAFLADYYYDTRYPGDNYEVVVDVATANDCVAICDTVCEELKRALEVYNSNKQMEFKIDANETDWFKS